MNIQQLAINGHDDQPLANTFIQLQAGASHLAVILPGERYTVERPLLYYTTRLLLDTGADVLHVNYDYLNRPNYGTLSEIAREAMLFADADAALNSGLAEGTYTRLTLVGKSLGTRSMSHLLTQADNLPATQAIWLTPLLTSDHVFARLLNIRQHSLHVIGTGDRFYQARRWQELRALPQTDMLLVQDADHSLNLPGDIPASLDILKRVMRGVQHFLSEPPGA